VLARPRATTFAADAVDAVEAAEAAAAADAAEIGLPTAPVAARTHGGPMHRPLVRTTWPALLPALAIGCADPEAPPADTTTDGDPAAATAVDPLAAYRPSPAQEEAAVATLQRLFDALETGLERTTDRRIQRLPLHINDPEFADALVAAYRDIA